MQTTERILTAYAEAEPWKADHDAAMRCLGMEENIAVGIAVLKLIACYEAAWQEHVATGKVPYDEAEDIRIGQFYQRWLQATERSLEEIQKLNEQGYEVKGTDELLIHLEEARSILESRILEVEMQTIEEVLPLAKGNPRPERYGR